MELYYYWPEKRIQPFDEMTIEIGTSTTQRSYHYSEKSRKPQCSNQSSFSYSMGVWRNTENLWPSYIHIKVGNGRTMSFWNDD